jgi:hypothetical protein
MHGEELQLYSSRSGVCAVFLTGKAQLVAIPSINTKTIYDLTIIPIDP